MEWIELTGEMKRNEEDCSKRENHNYYILCEKIKF